jgi:ubiquinone/menaquinone biosynthesis C-methylase UbiE
MACPAQRSAVQELYTKRIDRYSAFIKLFRAHRGLHILLQQAVPLQPGLKALDAGCGVGPGTFALLEALRRRKLAYERIDGFDLTPAMLSRLRQELDGRGVGGVRLRQADVLALDSLPDSWSGYDLILCASMLECLPKQELPRALAGLRARLAPDGHIVAMITRKSLETKVFVEWAWRAESYTRDEIERAFDAAQFRRTRFVRLPARYVWLNRASYVVVAER